MFADAIFVQAEDAQPEVSHISRLEETAIGAARIQSQTYFLWGLPHRQTQPHITSSIG